jgi:hypothetical protein
MEATKEFSPKPHHNTAQDLSLDLHYSPPWANTSIIGIAGSSGSGKTSLAYAIIKELSLPWVVILSSDSYYKPLTPEESKAAFRNEYDFDAPSAIDFDLLVDHLRDIKSGYATKSPWFTEQLANTRKGKRLTSLFTRSRSMPGSKGRVPRYTAHTYSSSRASSLFMIRACWTCLTSRSMRMQSRISACPAGCFVTCVSAAETSKVVSSNGLPTSVQTPRNSSSPNETSQVSILFSFHSLTPIIMMIQTMHSSTESLC